MENHCTMINLDSLYQAELKETPFPFLVTSDFLRKESKQKLADDFPQINFPGSVPLSGLNYSATFGQLMQELEGNALRSAISKRLNINLEGRPTFITLRGRTRMKDGRIHADTKSKLVTLLLYFNQTWDPEAGRLRILSSSNNLEQYIVEIPPVIGTCLIFKVTDNCWHGHKPFQGVRKAIQLNYLTDELALKKHLSKHSFSAKLKNLTRRVFGRESYIE